MLDGHSRTIDYVRISVTDRCNLCCTYCMPETGVNWLPHGCILRYEDIIRLCRIFAALGIRKFKITGGEPLVRRDLPRLIRAIKDIPDAESVTLTTNGVALKDQLPALLEAGVDGVNISIDTLDPTRYREITRRDALPAVLAGLDAALSVSSLNVKLNCVSMAGGAGDWVSLAALARDRPLAVRFIEPMPIGLGAGLAPCGETQVAAALEAAFGPLAPDETVRGNGPCRYFTLPGFSGPIGFISAVSHKFCAACNRVRLTATGYLKTCLQYDVGVDLAPLFAQGDDVLRAAIRDAILQKPAEHQFSQGAVPNREAHIMSQIGG